MYWTLVRNGKEDVIQIIAIKVKTIAIGETSELNSAETKFRRVFKCWAELVKKYWRTRVGKGRLV